MTFYFYRLTFIKAGFLFSSFWSSAIEWSEYLEVLFGLLKLLDTYNFFMFFGSATFYNFDFSSSSGPTYLT
jgi:hypothetical protein